MGVMRIMGAKTGDTEATWDPTNLRSTKDAKGVFDKNLGRGLLAFAPGGDDGGSVRLREFDPNAQEIIFTKQFVGG